MAKKQGPTRRDFIIGVGATATGVAVASCSNGNNCKCEECGTGGNSLPPNTPGSGGTQTGGAGGAGAGGSGGFAAGGSVGPASGGAGGAGTGGTGGAGAGGAGGTTTPSTECEICPPPTQCPTPASLPSEWAREADVVVLGTGFAALSAAISATDAKAKVLVLEKMSRAEEGGNSKVCGNMWWTPTSADEGIKYITAMCMGLTDDKCIQTLAQEMSGLNDYLATLGVRAASFGIFQPEYPELPGAASVRTWNNGAGVGLWQPLRDAVSSRKVEVLYDTPAIDLVQDPSTREIKGIVARSGGQNIHIKCKRGVVLACGGFEYNHDMQAQYLPGWPVYGRGTPGNTGDGIAMAQKAGAALWHMNNALANVGCFVPDPKDPKSIPISLSLPTGCILVDKFGSRFMDERRSERHGFGHKEYLLFFDGLKQAFTRLPCYAVFDETTRKAGKLQGGLAGWFGNHSSYTWSADNSAEVTSGWIKKGETLDALAAAFGANAATLSATVTRYNGFCTAGQDQDFGRSASTLKALTTAPFYAMPIYPIMYNTQGGPRRNERCQVITPTGEPIPRLYSAGELGSFWGWMYNGGGNAAEAVVTGRMAGSNSAAEAPWA
ncbi:MAG: FAD-binding protein [Deltaproteobacteria bacterium]|nr:FAD-binding protein [Deltaproteobacteria bacterium]